MGSRKKIALLGNPNSGKSSLFNLLTGSNQRVGNFSGVTVEKKSGICKLNSTEEAEIIDLPGAYSLTGTGDDEKVVSSIMLNPNSSDYPDLALIVIDGTNLKRNLFLATQLIDLKIPSVIAINFTDIVKKSGIEVNANYLEKQLGVKVIAISAKREIGIKELKILLSEDIQPPQKSFLDIRDIAGDVLEKGMQICPVYTPYQLYKTLRIVKEVTWCNEQEQFLALMAESDYNPYEKEVIEISKRYEKIHDILVQMHYNAPTKDFSATEKIDRWTTHPFWGVIIFLLTFFFMFQAIFTLSSYPMDWITGGMDWLIDKTANALPESWFTSMLTDGLMAGISGVLVFLPQIMILFGLISLLEDSGYLSRVSFMSDRVLRVFGMNGKSIIPLVGGFACAVPSIMAARTIENRKARLVTIFITPLMSCSARLPVYVFLTAFIVPDINVFGFLSLQGLFMTGIYLVGVIASLAVALLANKFMKQEKATPFLMELPRYRKPSYKNMIKTMWSKGKTFLFDAGKIIIMASIVLWFLSTNGPSSDYNRIQHKYEQLVAENSEEIQVLEREKNSELLAYSYIGYAGRFLEPVLQPIGFDWKTGIAVLSSFAAREVFVSTMATIYSIEDDSQTGLKSIKYDLPTAVSLLVFYLFALQCMSTVAIVKSETRSWKFAIIQFALFTFMAYAASFIVFQMIK